MRLTLGRASTLGAATAFTALAANAQTAPTRTLSKPDVEYKEPFTQVSGVRELKDGRVVVVDVRDKVVQIVDLASGNTVKVGREGSGPGEYSLPSTVFPLPGDTSAVLDGLNRRLLVVLPNGKPGNFIDLSPPSTGRGGGGQFIMGGARLSAIDSRGRFYALGSPFRVTESGLEGVDSAAIERWARGAAKHDTIGYVGLPKNNIQTSGSPGRGQFNVRMGGANPFAPQDQWAVAPDGRVAVVDADDYHITWIDASGKRTTTAPIKYDRLKVTEAHKQEWRDSRKYQLGMQVTNQNGKMSAQAVPMTNAPDPTDWPEYMPPFIGNAVSFAPNGTLWVRRTGPAGQLPTYDLVNAAGQVTQRVVLPKKAQVVGFGANNSVYVVRIDEDDLQYLDRYRLP